MDSTLAIGSHQARPGIRSASSYRIGEAQGANKQDRELVDRNDRIAFEVSEFAFFVRRRRFFAATSHVACSIRTGRSKSPQLGCTARRSHPRRISIVRPHAFVRGSGCPRWPLRPRPFGPRPQRGKIVRRAEVLHAKRRQSSATSANRVTLEGRVRVVPRLLVRVHGCHRVGKSSSPRRLPRYECLASLGFR